MLRKRLDYPHLLRAAAEQAELHRAGMVLIEDLAAGTQRIQELVAEGLYALTPYAPQGGNVMRLHAHRDDRERVRASAGGCTMARRISARAHDFPKGRRDDQADSTVQALDWIKEDAIAPTGGQWLRIRNEIPNLP